MLILFATALRNNEAANIRLSDCKKWREPGTGNLMLHITVKAMKNMARDQSHVRAIPWDFLAIGPRMVNHVTTHGLPQGSFLLRCPPQGNAPWSVEPDCPYTQAGECVKRLMGPGAQTHGGRRGCVQLFRSLGASDTEINEFARWRSDKMIKE